jgi:lipoprotein-releasing system ATP-binding protein
VSSNGKTLVAIHDVWKKFLHEGREVVVLKGIDLTIEEGEMLAVVGPSGAGKSTLLHILGTLDLPTAGRIEYEGRDVTRYSSSRLADFRNRALGFVFQFHHLLPEFTALENVKMPGMIRGQSERKLDKRARELLDEVGLSHRLSHRPGELSGGEQQRVALARALVMDPKLVLADEPTGNLDSGTSESIHKLFFDLNRSRGTTFLLVTHSRDLADRMPRMVSMRDGKVEQDIRREPSDGPFRRAEPGAPPSRVEAGVEIGGEIGDEARGDAEEPPPAGAAEGGEDDAGEQSEAGAEDAGSAEPTEEPAGRAQGDA